jgi:hypothetical protein
MPKKIWTVPLEDGAHTVEFDLRTWGGKWTIRVDGAVVREGRMRSFDMGGDYPFQIGGKTLAVHARSSALAMSYDLSVDDHSITTGHPIEPLRPLPRWAWIFIVACLAAVVIWFGRGGSGAIPAGIVGGVTAGAAALCVVFARDPSRPRNVSIALCLVATVCVWVVAFGLSAPLDAIPPSISAPVSIADPIQASDWEEFTSTAGRFSVVMPGAPVEQTQVVETDAGAVDLYMYLVDKGTAAYIAGYADYPQELISQTDTQTLLQNARDGALANVGGSLMNERSISLDGHAGLEIEVETSDPPTQVAYLVARFYLVENRLYQTLVVTLNNASSDTERFLDSFVLLGP